MSQQHDLPECNFYLFQVEDNLCMSAESNRFTVIGKIALSTYCIIGFI